MSNDIKTLDIYTKGVRAWFPDEREGWVIGILSSIDKSASNVKMTFTVGNSTVVYEKSIDELMKTKFSSLPPLDNPPILLGVDDLASLSYLHEPAVLNTIRHRYLQESIYTYSGIVLVAMNPFYKVPLYSQDIMREYSGKNRGDLDPHLFAVAEEAYRNMINGKNQSIIVSGESGAGKTMSAKYIMRYFATIADLEKSQDSLNSPVDGSAHINVEDAVLSTNPIMEAFGNAKTTRNDNSSRFGKYIEIIFRKSASSASVKITGAKIRTYLLERSRLIFQPPIERNYHIFYQLCAGAPAAEKASLFLDSWDSFYYLNRGETGEINGVDDAAEFIQTQKALSVIGISVSNQWDIFKVCAAVLQIGNIKVTGSRDEASISDTDCALNNACQLLGVDKGSFKKWILKKQIITRSEKITTALNVTQALVARDSVAKFLYSVLFDWIVKTINTKLVDGKSDKKTESFIGVLDIYGFEHFKTNSFEQFCINYANEKLQQEFNRHVFKLEQEEYVAEEINWSFIDFADNQPCIDMIEGKLGILDLLDEESRLPSGADGSYISKLYQRFAKDNFFAKPRFGQTAFTVKHYACDVTYEVAGFIDKNKDTVADEQLQVLQDSSTPFVVEISKIEETSKSQQELSDSRPKGRTSIVKKPTLGSIFKESLISLMATIHETEVNYIRCIKPNEAKAAFSFEAPMVLAQLRACGVLETIRISNAGYPSRYIFSDFAARYYLLIHSKERKGDPKAVTMKIVNKTITVEDKYQVGKTKIFFRAGQLAYLEKLRTERLRECVVLIQKNYRRFMYRKKFIRLRAAVITIQTNIRSWIYRTKYRRHREEKAAIVIQKYLAGWHARKRFLRTKKAAVKIQSVFRMAQARKKYLEMRYLSSVVKIQSAYRGYLARRDQIKRNGKIALIQGLWRRKKAIKLLKELKIEAKSVGKLQETNYALENKVIKLSQDLQQKNKECKELNEKITQLDSQLTQFKERFKKAEVSRKSLFAENASEQSELKKQLDSYKEIMEDSKNTNRELTTSLNERNHRIQELEEELSKERSKPAAPRISTLSAAPLVQSEQVAILQKEVASLKEEIARLLGSKYKAEAVSEKRKSEAEKTLVSPRFKQVFSISQSPYSNEEQSPTDAIPEIKRIVRTLTAVEVQDEILEVLIINLRIPLPNSQHTPTLTDIVFPSHLLGFVALKQVGSNISGHMVHMMGNTMKQIQDFTAKFEDDYVSSFWLSNVNQLLCIFTTAVESDIPVIGRCRLPLIQRNAENIAALDKIKTEMGILRTRIYQGWMKELKKRVSNMIVPAIIENQSLPGYVCDQSGGIWSSWAKSITSVSITIDQLVNFLSKLETTMKWYKIDEIITRQILTELIRFMGVSAFNHLILRKNFCTWKRGVQIQYNVSRLEEFCTNQGIAEATLHLQQLLQAAKVLTLNKTSPAEIETIFDVCFLLNPSQIKKLLTVYHAADFDSPMSADLLKIVTKRAILNEKSDAITLDLDIGPDIPMSMADNMKEINPFIPSWIELPYLQAILSETMTNEEYRDKSLRNNELSTASSSKTYKSSKRSHVNKSTALLDKSNSQILQDRAVPQSVRKKKLHKARKLFVKTPNESLVDQSIKEKPEIDELDLILMDMHKANEIRLEALNKSHQEPVTQINDIPPSMDIPAQDKDNDEPEPVDKAKDDTKAIVTVDQFLVHQESRRSSDQQKLLEDDLLVGKGEFACMGISKDKMTFSTAIKFYKRI